MAGFIERAEFVTLVLMYEYPAPESPQAPSLIDRLTQNRALAVGLFAVIAVIGGLLGMTLAGDDGDGAEEAAPTTTASPSPTTTANDSTESATSDVADGDGAEENATEEEFPLIEGEATEPVDLIEPLGTSPTDPEPLLPVDVDPLAEACAAAAADGENLVVRPDPVSLPAGTNISSLEVHNCGAGSVDWTASTVPWVALDSAAGSLGGGETAILGYTIDTSDQPLGAFDFRIKVSEPGHNTYVDVDGFHQAVGSDFQAGSGSFTAGAGAGGCNNQCITSALLSDNATTPNLSLRVVLDTPANVDVWVSTSPPLIDDDGDPYYSGIGLSAFTAGLETDWTAPIGSLEWATDYYILVEARDADGGVSHRSGEFRTRNAGAGTSGDFANPVDAGCSSQCIETGTVVPDPDSPNDVEVIATSKVAARWTLWVSTQNPKLIDGIPTLGDEWKVFTTPGFTANFARQVDDLDWNTTYYVVVEAQDDMGRSSYHSGFFATGEEPKALVTVQIIEAIVTNDADGTGRGEITFQWGIPGVHERGIWETRLSDGDRVPFETGEGIYQEFLGEDAFVPALVMTMSERDWKPGEGFIGFTPLTIDRGSDDDRYFWNGTGIGFVPVAGVDDLPRCEVFGIEGAWADHACVEASTINTYGAQFPGFTAVIGIHVDRGAPDDALPPWQN